MSAEKKKKKEEQEDFSLRYSCSIPQASPCLSAAALSKQFYCRAATHWFHSLWDRSRGFASKWTHKYNQHSLWILIISLGGGISSLFSMTLKCKVSTSANAPIFCCPLGHRGQSCLVFVPKSIDCIRHWARAFERKAPWMLACPCIIGHVLHPWETNGPLKCGWPGRPTYQADASRMP